MIYVCSVVITTIRATTGVEFYFFLVYRTQCVISGNFNTMIES